jgi:glycosyltransferase involved in cell wall biosynthesis
MTILEAMSMELPIFSTPEGGIPDIIDNGINGYLCPQKDAATLALKLEELLLNPSIRQEMGKAAKIKYERVYTLETFENRMVSILNKVLST